MAQSNQGLVCEITSSKQAYTLGEVPEIQVTIRNNTKKSVYLIKCLDGSQTQRRYPYCYFEIKKPVDEKLLEFEGCGYINTLLKDDFVKLEAGQTLDLLEGNNALQMSDRRNFRHQGKYEITFYYSTKEKDIKKYRLYKKEATEIHSLFQKVPKTILQSNTLEIEFVE